MKVFCNTRLHLHKKDLCHNAEINDRRRKAAMLSAQDFRQAFDIPSSLNEQSIKLMKLRFGTNKIVYQERHRLLKRLLASFLNPFTSILLVLAVVSYVLDVQMVSSQDEDFTTVIIILTMVIISGCLRFIQETRSGNAAEKLSQMVKTTAAVRRDQDDYMELPLEELVVGDVIHLAAGDMLPADVRLLQTKDFFVSQAALTGESEPVEKHAEKVSETVESSADYADLAFAGSNVISGTATALIIAVGSDTILGETASSMSKAPDYTGFEKGVNAVSWVLIRFMLVMVPVVFLLNGLTVGNWMAALLFAISIAVGLTPEMLPMIVTTCLAKGAVMMSRHKTIIKKLNSIQNLGAMDVLCTDKTGTLTQDKVVLEYHLNVHGERDTRVLKHAFLNSYFQTGLKNLLDHAIIQRTMQELGTTANRDQFISHYQKVDEIPFDFERRRMSVVIRNTDGKTQMITKGAVEEMLSICSYVEYQGEVRPFTEELRRTILKMVRRFNQDGMRVLAVAQKNNPSPVGTFSVADEKDLVLIGYLTFLDPPKRTAAAAIKALLHHGVVTKVLTGDNEQVTRTICKQVGLEVQNLVLGADLEQMTDEQLGKTVEETTVFAKLSPQQKARLVTALQKKGHTVGFLGDGINDAPALKTADVGISVDTAVDIAKESAAVVLLEKDLMVLANGIMEGRKTYANMIKYIKMTASSNFGNMFSVLVASAFLPFLPMLSIHLLVLNLIYDLSCTAIPWDNVDAEYLKKPRQWNASSIASFMIWIGPISSIFDITTYLLMYYVICPAACGGLNFDQLTDPAQRDLFISLFQTGWFVESMWSQTLVIHMIRTPKIPFLQSRASMPVTLLTFAGIACLTAIPFMQLGAKLGLTPLSGSYFFWLIATIILYMLSAQFIKTIYIRKYGELL